MDSNMKSVLRSYLQKCGDGRNLEKFLRRNSYSSDERDNSTPITTKCRNKTKSLESLTVVEDRTTSVSSEIPLKKKDKKAEEKTKDKEEVQEKPKSMEAKVVVKQGGEKTDKKKTKFNYESIIEITLPAQANLPLSELDLPFEKSAVTIEDKEEPIKPIISASAKPKIPPHNTNKSNMSPISTHESFVSNKQNPMEWDTFIPGYDESSTQQSFQLCNPMELSDSEMNALKTYFQQNGLQLPNKNMVVVIKNRKETNPDRQFSEIKRNKEKWQNIYEKYKEKYHKCNIEFLSPEAMSTPKVQEDLIDRLNEKSSQTSLRNCGKSTQVEPEDAFSVEQSSKECQVTIDKGKGTRSKHSLEGQTDLYHNQSETAESFEFIAGSMKRQQDKGSQLSSSGKSSTKDEDISNFDDSLKVAISLLNSLLESRHMKPDMKRNLAGKVIQKIVQIQTSRSIQTSTLGSCGMYPLSHSSQSNSSVAEVKSIKESVVEDLSRKNSSKSSLKKSRESALKDCLKPMTQSEMIHNHLIDEKHTKSSTGSEQVPKDQLMDYVKKEKESHLKWIEKEIEHLRNLRDLLKRDKASASSDPLYENLSSLMRQTVEKESEIPEDKVEIMPPPSNNPWNSHAYNKKTNKIRSKLETPENATVPSCEESLASFIDKKNQKFLEKYKMHQQVYEEVYARPSARRVKQTEAPRVGKSKSSSKKSLATVTKDVPTSTSLASSSVFESSDSISVPVNTNNTKSSTTHYRSEISQKFASKDEKDDDAKTKLKVAETQTSDSICRTRPIFEAKKNVENSIFGTTSTTVTQRIQRNTNDKQQQAQPPSVKYTLTFDKKCRSNVREYTSLPQKTYSEAISKSSKEIYNQISCSTLDNRRSEDKENYDADTIIDDDDEIDLQSCLTHKRPDIFLRFEERKRCIQELKKLRALRNEHRKTLLLLTSDKSLEGKLFNILPEMPLKTTRMFSTKALKLQTQKKLKNLSENLQKKNDENMRNLKRKNRLMTEIFNKNLQRNVLKGNLNLSNTVNLISK